MYVRLISELKGADVVATPSRERRGGVAEQGACCVNKGPEISTRSWMKVANQNSGTAQVAKYICKCAS